MVHPVYFTISTRFVGVLATFVTSKTWLTSYVEASSAFLFWYFLLEILVVTTINILFLFRTAILWIWCPVSWRLSSYLLSPHDIFEVNVIIHVIWLLHVGWLIELGHHVKAFLAKFRGWFTAIHKFLRFLFVNGAHFLFLGCSTKGMNFRLHTTMSMIVTPISRMSCLPSLSLRIKIVFLLCKGSLL